MRCRSASSAPLRAPFSATPPTVTLPDRRPPTVTLNLFVLCTPAAPGSISRPKTSVYVARWMLNQVQHDAGRNMPFYHRRPSVGWGLSRVAVGKQRGLRDALRRDGSPPARGWRGRVWDKGKRLPVYKKRVTLPSPTLCETLGHSSCWHCVACAALSIGAASKTDKAFLCLMVPAKHWLEAHHLAFQKLCHFSLQITLRNRLLWCNGILLTKENPNGYRESGAKPSGTA